jgi:glycerol-3-phosphate dehydrogenase
VLDHGKLGGARGVYSVVGGKLSTFRPLAEEVVARLDPPQKRPVHTDQPPAGWRESLLESGLPKPSLRHLRVYGAAIPEVLALGREVLCAHSGAITGEVRHAMRNEHVTALGDIMLRRTGISWAACRGLCCHREVAAVAAKEAGWSSEQVTDQVRAFEEEVAYHLPTEESLAADHFAAG